MSLQTDSLLAQQRAALLNSIGDLHRFLEDDDNWRALAALESVGAAAGGVPGAAWAARRDELSAALAENPIYRVCKELERSLAVIDQLLEQSGEPPQAADHRPDTGMKPVIRTASIAERIAPLEMAHSDVVRPLPPRADITEIGPSSASQADAVSVIARTILADLQSQERPVTLSSAQDVPVCVIEPLAPESAPAGPLPLENTPAWAQPPEETQVSESETPAEPSAEVKVEQTPEESAGEASIDNPPDGEAILSADAEPIDFDDAVLEQPLDGDFEAEVSIVARLQPADEAADPGILQADGEAQEAGSDQNLDQETLEQRLQRLDRLSQNLVAPDALSLADAADTLEDPARENKWLEMIRARRAKHASAVRAELVEETPDTAYAPDGVVLEDTNDFDGGDNLEAEVKIVHRKHVPADAPRSQKDAGTAVDSTRPSRPGRSDLTNSIAVYGVGNEEARVEIVRRSGSKSSTDGRVDPGAASGGANPSEAAASRFIKTLTGE